MPQPLTQGWLPIDIEFDPEPAVITSASVRWMEFGDRRFEEPFFRQTLTAMLETVPPPTLIDDSLDAMLRMSSRLPPVLPAGFIFHISHCGSTLLANALKLAPPAVVASEPMPFMRLARWYPETSQPYLRQRWFGTRHAAFDSLVRLYSHYRTGASERLVVKFPSMCLFGMKFVRQAFPEVPCVLLVRDPIEVLMSALRGDGWLADKKEPANVAQLYGWTDPPRPFEEMSDEEYCARLLGRHLEAALDAVDDRCRVIDYEDLNHRRIRDIAAFFGLELSGDHRKLFQTYSKDPAGSMPFCDDRTQKRRLASQIARSMAQQWAMRPYIDLRGKGGW